MVILLSFITLPFAFGFISKSIRPNYNMNPLLMQINSRDLDLYDRIATRESISELLDDVDRANIKEAYFTNDLKKIYTIHKDEKDSDSTTMYDLTLTYTSPTLTQSFLDSSRRAHVKNVHFTGPSFICNHCVTNWRCIEWFFIKRLLFCIDIIRCIVFIKK